MVALNKLLFNKHYHKSSNNGFKENESVEENVAIDKSNVKINVEAKVYCGNCIYYYKSKGNGGLHLNKTNLILNLIIAKFVNMLAKLRHI